MQHIYIIFDITADCTVNDKPVYNNMRNSFCLQVYGLANIYFLSLVYKSDPEEWEAACPGLPLRIIIKAGL